MTSATEELLAFPDSRARQLAGVSMRRLRYWEETGLVVPSIKRELSPKHTVRLYSFTDLLSLPDCEPSRLSRRDRRRLTVWASEHRAVVVSTDREFSRRRMKNAIGHHLWLRCLDWEADGVLEANLAEVIIRLEARNDLTIRVSGTGLTDSSAWS